MVNVPVPPPEVKPEIVAMPAGVGLGVLNVPEKLDSEIATVVGVAATDANVTVEGEKRIGPGVGLAAM
jgi:hypothetical protein